VVFIIQSLEVTLHSMPCITLTWWWWNIWTNFWGTKFPLDHSHHFPGPLFTYSTPYSRFRTLQSTETNSQGGPSEWRTQL